MAGKSKRHKKDFYNNKIEKSPIIFKTDGKPTKQLHAQRTQAHYAFSRPDCESSNHICETPTRTYWREMPIRTHADQAEGLPMRSIGLPCKHWCTNTCFVRQ